MRGTDISNRDEKPVTHWHSGRIATMYVFCMDT